MLITTCFSIITQQQNLIPSICNCYEFDVSQRKLPSTSPTLPPNPSAYTPCSEDNRDSTGTLVKSLGSSKAGSPPPPKATLFLCTEWAALLKGSPQCLCLEFSYQDYLSHERSTKRLSLNHYTGFLVTPIVKIHIVKILLLLIISRYIFAYNILSSHFAINCPNV